MKVVIFDNEAVQVLADGTHPKRGRLMAHIAAVAVDRKKGRKLLVVPTTVRVEAGWDRTDPAYAGANRFTVRDHLLSQTGANQAAAIVRRTGVSPADAHVAVAALEHIDADAVVVVTSDDSDIKRAVDHRDVHVVHL